MSPTPLNWDLYTEAVVGRNHPTLTDTANRALRQLLTTMSLNPDSNLNGFPAGILWADAFGAAGDGVTDDTTAIQTAENARTAGQILKFTPGKTYLVETTYNGTIGAAPSLLQIKVAGTWDFTGATIKYGSATNLTIGSDSGALGILNVLASDVTLQGTIDCNSKSRFAFAVQDLKLGTRFDLTIKGVIEPSQWTGIGYNVSVDASGVALGTRAVNVGGIIKRPSCPVINASDTVTGHTDVTAFIVGAQFNAGNSTGGAIVWTPGTTNAGAMIVRVDINGIPSSSFAGDHNLHFLDLILHDIGCNLSEILGTSVAGSAGFGATGSDTVGHVYKNATSAIWGHGNLGTDGSSPSVAITARAAGQAEIDFDYNPGGGLAGGRLIEKITSPTETVLVSGVDARNGNVIQLTLTAARLVGAPLNPRKGQRLLFSFIQGGAGGFAVTWNAVFKKTWSDAGNATGARSSIAYVYDGTNWTQDSAQAPYV